MALFATRARRATAAGPEAGREPPDLERAGLPPGFVAVGEALASGADPTTACAVLGRRLARDGVSLHEALATLRETTYAVVGGEPGFDLTQALAVAWSEATLAHFHQVSCEDPMTGLDSAAHLRSRVTELYRGELRDRPVGSSYALVVVDLPAHDDHLGAAWAMTRAGEALRTVFAGVEPIARLGVSRIVVLAARDEQLGRRVALARRFVGAVQPGVRAWIEGLPASDASAGLLLDELAHC